MGVKTLAPRTFDIEISLDTYSDPERQLTLAAARVLRDDQASRLRNMDTLIIPNS